MASSTTSSKTFLADLLPHHVYLKLKAERGDNIRRVADAIIRAHAAQATAIVVATSPPYFPRATRLQPPHPRISVFYNPPHHTLDLYPSRRLD